MGTPGRFRALRGLSITWFMIALQIQMAILIAGVYHISMKQLLQVDWLGGILAVLAIITNIVVFWLDKKPN